MLQSKQAIEKYRIFPYVAWALVVGFSIFVYIIVQDLQATSQELAETATKLQQQATTPPGQITDFSR